jgi:hypothetical protein
MLKDRLKESYLYEYVDYTDYFRYDTEDSTPSENEDLYYYDIREELERYSLTLEEVQIEHDCITGDLIEIQLG